MRDKAIQAVPLVKTRPVDAYGHLAAQISESEYYDLVVSYYLAVGSANCFPAITFLHWRQANTTNMYTIS